MPTRIRSHSKINLGLALGPLRADGFHGLTTVYQTLALHDVVSVEARRTDRTSIEITSTHPAVPTDSSNTAWQMAERSLAALGVQAAVRIHIDKKLPVQGGLGAGSANAVAALLGLEHELEVKIQVAEKLRLAAEVGSDVPLFLLGGAVIGVGRGEEVYPLPDGAALTCVLALPEIGVSTAQAFRDWDRLHAAAPGSNVQPANPQPSNSLTGATASATMRGLSRSIAGAMSEPHSSGVFSQGENRAGNPLLALVRTGIENDFEQVVFPQYPFLGEIKRILAGGPQLEDAAVYAALSGSGSALFGLYRTDQGAQAALNRLQAQGITGLCTQTMPREEYWRGMKIG